jgi:hypothetical protein
MDKLHKIYFNFGSGYVEITDVQFSGTLSRALGDNPAIVRIQNDIECVVSGLDFASVFAEIADNIVIPYKVEALNNSGSFYTFSEGECNIRANIDHEAEQITLNVFNILDEYSEIYKNWEIDYDVKRFVDRYTVKTKETPIYFENTPICWDGNRADYPVNYTPEGEPWSEAFRDPRWDNFEWVSESQADCAVDFRKFIYGSEKVRIATDGYSRMIFDNELMYAKPNTSGTTTDVENTVTIEAHRLSDLLNEIVSRVDTSLTFDNSNLTYSGADFDLDYFEMISILKDGKESDAKLNIKQLLEFIADFYQMFWYVDATANELKFKHATELTKSASAKNLTSIENGKLKTSYISEIPLREKWTMPNVKTLDWTYDNILYPFDVGSELTYNIPFSTDFEFVWNNLDTVDSAGWVVMRTYVDGSDNFIEFGATSIGGENRHNYLLSLGDILSDYWTQYRYFKSGVIGGSSFTFNATKGRPVQQFELNDNYEDISDIDFTSYVTTSIGNCEVRQVSTEINKGVINYILTIEN